MNLDPVRYGYDAVMAACAPGELINALAAGLAAQNIVTPPRAHHDFGRGTLLLMPAWRSVEIIAVKIATVIPENLGRGLPAVRGDVLLISAATGELLAMLDGSAVTQLRTAAIAGLAAERLSRSTATKVLVAGTGALAPAILAALVDLGRFERITLWGRDVAKARALLTRSKGLANKVNLAENLLPASQEADVVICATSATTPLITPAHLKPDGLLILMGSFRLDMQEAAPDCFRDALVVVDSQDALEEAGDLRDPVSRGLLDPSAITRLDDVLTGFHAPVGQRVIFKSVGSAAFDLICADFVFRALRSAKSTPSMTKSADRGRDNKA